MAEYNALLAQLDRVTGYEPVGQGFESLAARQVHAVHHRMPSRPKTRGFFVLYCSGNGACFEHDSPPFFECSPAKNPAKVFSLTKSGLLMCHATGRCGLFLLLYQESSGSISRRVQAVCSAVRRVNMWRRFCSQVGERSGIILLHTLALRVRRIGLCIITTE